MSGREIELKLGLDPEGLERLKRHPLVIRTRRGRGSFRKLSSAYFDTPDLALSKAGISLRVRTAAGRLIQTVKTSGTRASGLFSRGEWESPLMAPLPDPMALRATGLPLFADESLPSRLAPLFVTEVRRTAYRLGGEGWEVEMALDLGEVVASGKRLAFSEVELELIEGTASHLFELARQITEAVPGARLMAISKSDRGYLLASGRQPPPVKSRPVALVETMTVAQGFQAVARNCLEHLLANEHCLLAARDPEAIHQMRVALRRFRSALKVFARTLGGGQIDTVRDELRWLLSVLGPARDTYVFLAEIVAPVAARHEGHAGMTRLLARWQAEKDRAFEAAIIEVTRPRFTALVLDLGAWVENGDWLAACAGSEERLADFAARVLAKCHRKMTKAGGDDITRLPAPELHQLRILGKRLRYAGEFFAPLFPGRNTRPFLDALARLQDTLGGLNDIAVAIPRLEGGAGMSTEEHWAAGAIAGWLDAGRPALMEKAVADWTTFRASKRFWKGE